MYEFQLYQKNDDAFPNELVIGDEAYPIDADYRIILRIFRVQEQVNVSQAARNLKTLRLFYKDKYPPDNPFLYFKAFVNRCKEAEPSNKAPVMDFFYDADVIYTSFRMQYGIDLIRTAFLHWYEFLMLVDGLTDNTPLQERIKIRLMKTDGLKGEDLANALRAKKSVALPQVETEENQRALLSKFGIDGGGLSG